MLEFMLGGLIGWLNVRKSLRRGVVVEQGWLGMWFQQGWAANVCSCRATREKYVYEMILPINILA